MESRNVDPDNLTLVETSLTLLLVPFSPLEGLKGHLFYVTNLSPIYVRLTRWPPCEEAAGGRGRVCAPCNGPVRSAELAEPLLSWCLGSPTQRLSPDGAWGPGPMAWLWVSLNPKPHHRRGWWGWSPHASAQHHGGDVPWEAGLSSPGSHSCKCDSRNWLLLDGSMTSCKHVCGHRDCCCFHSVSSVQASLQQDWKFAHVCEVLAASDTYCPLKKKGQLKKKKTNMLFS